MSNHCAVPLKLKYLMSTVIIEKLIEIHNWAKHLKSSVLIPA